MLRSGLIHHDRGPPNRLAAAFHVGGDGIADGISDRLSHVALLGDLSRPLMQIRVVSLKPDPYSHRTLLRAGTASPENATTLWGGLSAERNPSRWPTHALHQ